MAFNYATHVSIITEQEVIDYASKARYYTALEAPYTSPADMIKIAEY